MEKHILSVSYDQPLLVTRQLILEQAGYDVSSAFGFAEAMEVCKIRHDFDLILMCHSMPQKDKTALLAALRPECQAPCCPYCATVTRRYRRPVIQSIPATAQMRCWPP